MKDSTRELELLRFEMLSIDRAVIHLIAERMQLSKKIGAVKKNLSLPIDQPEIWNQTSLKRNEFAIDFNLSIDLIVDIYNCIHFYSKENQIND